MPASRVNATIPTRPRSAEPGTGAEPRALRPAHVFALAVCALGLGLDLAELAIGSTLSALFSAPPHAVDPQTLSWLLGAVFIGVVIGAPLAGWYADTFGRRAALVATAALLAVTSLAAACAPGFKSLFVFRTLSGLPLGAYPPLIGAYLTDILPAERRGRLIMMTVAVATLVPPALVFLVRWLTPLQPLGVESWRWAFAACCAAAVLCLALSRHLPESPRWLANRGRIAEAREASRRLGLAAFPRAAESPAGEAGGDDALEGRVFARRIAVLILLYFLTPWSAVVFPLLSGAILIQKGFAVSDSLLYVGIASVGPTIGGLIASLAIDRIARKAALLFCPFALMTLAYLFITTTTPGVLMAAGLGFSMIGVTFQAILVLYTAELFPVGQRARASSLSWAARGLGSAMAPLVLLPLLQASGPMPMFSVIAGTLAAFAALLWLCAPSGEAAKPDTNVG